MLPTGFRTFYFVSFLYVFLFSFLFLLFRFFSHYFVFVFLRFVFFVSFRYFSPCFLFVFFLSVSFRFFSFFSVSQFTGTPRELLSNRHFTYSLKLYCRYLYTRPGMINHIWSLKQLWLQVNGHAWFHLQRLRWPVRNGEGVKNSKWKYMSPAGFEPTPCQSTTGKLQRLRPLGHEGLMVISG